MDGTRGGVRRPSRRRPSPQAPPTVAFSDWARQRFQQGGSYEVGQVAGQLIAAGGGNIIAPGGGNVIAAGGGNLTPEAIAAIIAPGGGNIIAPGGGNIIAPGGGNLTEFTQGIIAAGGGNVIAPGGGNFADAITTLVIRRGVESSLQQPDLVGRLIAAGGGNIIAPSYVTAYKQSVSGPPHRRWRGQPPLLREAPIISAASRGASSPPAGATSSPRAEATSRVAGRGRADRGEPIGAGRRAAATGQDLANHLSRSVRESGRTDYSRPMAGGLRVAVTGAVSRADRSTVRTCSRTGGAQCRRRPRGAGLARRSDAGRGQQPDLPGAVRERARPSGDGAPSGRWAHGISRAPSRTPSRWRRTTPPPG